jgi:hypothetical protein
MVMKYTAAVEIGTYSDSRAKVRIKNITNEDNRSIVAPSIPFTVKTPCITSIYSILRPPRD